MTKKFDGILILTDLDGTLLNSSGECSPENRTAIEYFIANGGRFSFATGRALGGVARYLSCVPVNAPAIISNGAVVYDFAQGKMLKNWSIGPEGRMLVKELMVHCPGAGIEVYNKQGGFVVNANYYTRRHAQRVDNQLQECTPEQVDDPWVNILITDDPEKISVPATYAMQHYGSRFFMQPSLPHFLEILARDASKGTAAQYICSLLGISPNNLYAVGDGTNDLELLRSTQNSCAPENAVEEAKKVARFILPDNDSHAIRTLIERIEKSL